MGGVNAQRTGTPACKYFPLENNKSMSFAGGLPAVNVYLGSLNVNMLRILTVLLGAGLECDITGNPPTPR